MVVVKQWLGYAVQFADTKNQALYECPISLAPFYRPVGIAGSDPKHVFSEPIIDELTRTCKQDPLDNSVLEGHWKVSERDIEKQLSAAVVICLFAHKGNVSNLMYYQYIVWCRGLQY